MDADHYQREAKKTAIYPKALGIVYPALGLCGESGELATRVLELCAKAGKVAESVKKPLRDNNQVYSANACLAIAQELGDVQWYVSKLADDIGFTLSQIMVMNLEKLQDRKERDKLKGSGDER